MSCEIEIFKLIRLSFLICPQLIFASPLPLATFRPPKYATTPHGPATRALLLLSPLPPAARAQLTTAESTAVRAVSLRAVPGTARMLLAAEEAARGYLQAP